MSTRPRFQPGDFGCSQLIQSIRDVVMVVESPDGQIVLWNPAAEAVFGFPADEALGLTLTDLVAVEAVPRVREALARCRAPREWAAANRRRPIELEIPARRKTGESIVVEVTLSAVSDPPGGGSYALVITRDVTERRRAEEALRRSEAYFRSLIENALDIIALLDPHGVFTYVTPSIRRTLGYDPSEVIGRNAFALVHPDDADMVHQTYQDGLITPGPPPRLEFRFRHRDGSWRFLEATGRNLIEDGRVVGAVIHGRDITAQKRAEEERAQLRREQSARAEAEAAQRRLAFLAEASTRLASSLDYETTLSELAGLAVPILGDWCIVDIVEEDQSLHRVTAAHVDPAKQPVMQELLDRYPLDLVSKHPAARVLQSGMPELVPEVTDEMIEAMAIDPRHREIVRDLSPKTFLVVPLLGRGGTLGSLSFASAKPGHHYTRAALDLALDLARRAALAVENARLYQQAQEAVRARNEFLSTVSHDLKSPIATIKATLFTLRRRIERSGLTEKDPLLDGLARIDQTATKMVRHLGLLLDLARLQLGQPLQLERSPVDLVALARQVIDDQQKQTDRVQLRLDAAVPTVVGVWDAFRLERALINLVINAVKYSPDGGEILVTIRTESDPMGTWAVLEVRDQGLGIPAQDLPRIFERFHRASNVAGHITGSGVGLASVRHIVEEHGGSIRVESEEGNGSTFILRLPIAAGGAGLGTARRAG